MMTTERMSAAENNDAELVAGSLAGQRDGFRQIVERYQSLVCSLGYSATGSLSESEDLAQETFVAAWKQLAELREPSKLRSWLCGIRQTKIMVVWMVLFNAVVAAYIFAAVNSWSAQPLLFTALGISIPLLLTGSILVMALRYNREFRRIREVEMQLHPESFQNENGVDDFFVVERGRREI